jgi:sulfatase maturation enzyme AslB (radical SAM superfamily)
MDGAPVHSLELVLTASCNLKCSYCFQNRHQDRRMTWETAQAAVDRLFASPGERKVIDFYGGEPLLEFPLIERTVAYARAHPARRTLGFGITTNGTRLVPVVADFLAAHDFRTRLSFDGVATAQDVRGRGTFPILDHVLADLATRHSNWFKTRVRIQSTLTPDTVGSLSASVDYFLDRGVAELLVYPSILPDERWTAVRIDQLREQFRIIGDRHLEHYRKTGTIPMPIFRGRDAPRTGATHAPAPRAMCGAGEAGGIAVDVDGEASGCVLFVDSYQSAVTPYQAESMKTLRMGTVGTEEFERRLRDYPAAARATRLFHGKEKKYSSFAKCGECRFLATCSVCPMSIGRRPGEADPDRVPDFLCAFNLVAHEERERFIRGRRRIDAARERRHSVDRIVNGSRREQSLLAEIDRSLGF